MSWWTGGLEWERNDPSKLFRIMQEPEEISPTSAGSDWPPRAAGVNQQCPGTLAALLEGVSQTEICSLFLRWEKLLGSSFLQLTSEFSATQTFFLIIWQWSLPIKHFWTLRSDIDLFYFHCGKNLFLFAPLLLHPLFFNTCGGGRS